MIVLSLIDKMKNKIRRKSIDDEIDSVFRDESSYSKRVLDANRRPQNNNVAPEQFRSRFPSQNTARPLQAQSTGRPYDRVNTPLLKSRQGIQQQATPDLPDEDEFMRQRFGGDKIDDKNIPPPPDLLGLPGNNMDNHLPRRDTPFRHVSGAGSNDALDELLLSMKDLRAQNNHIIDLLRNIQDRLSKH